MSEFEALDAFATAFHDDVARLLMSASIRINADALEQVDPTGSSGVRSAHVPLIAALDSSGTRLSTLAARMRVTRQAVAELAHALENAGLVTVAPDPTDARAVLVTLTPRGLAFCERATELMLERELAWRGNYGDEAIDSFKEILRGLAGEATE